MGKKNKIRFLTISVLLLFLVTHSYAQSLDQDIKDSNEESEMNYEDTLKTNGYKKPKNKLARLAYDFLITQPRPYVDKQTLALNYYQQIQGKTISSIDVTALDVFGPSLKDTTKKAHSWLEKTANTVHTKSNLRTIQKLFLFEIGDTINPEVMYESERLIRSLPYIKDIQILFETDSLQSDQVKLHVITQDRFSLGISGGVSSLNSADAGIYNQNIFGVGHEISFRFVGHLQRQPYMGLETFYKIKNIKGKFIDIAAGYLNTYKKEGFQFFLDKPFITTSVKWGYGTNAIRYYRTDRIFEDDPVKANAPMDLSYLSAWVGRSFQLRPEKENKAQMILSTGFYNRTYFSKPATEPEYNQYFSNSTFYLAGITFTQRRFVQDQLVYSYGITEDIPEGFKNEIVYGFDANEFGDRHYAHLFFSNGNLLINRKGYLYLAGGIGGFFNQNGYEQGQIQGSLNFISRQINTGNKRFRLFVRTNYMMGLKRFDIEQLTLKENNLIRGFSSKNAVGKQRLSVDLEYVLFLRREFQRFNMAVFGFADIGVIGSNKKLIFTENYYSGLGLGVRFHNENLVFKTFHLRLAFYPFHPDDMSFVGFILEEQSKRKFYSFEPTAPYPLRFE